MLDIDTFDNLRGGNVAYKALAHPVAAGLLSRLAASLSEAGSIAIYDPEGIAKLLIALCPDMAVAGIYVHDTQSVGQLRGGHATRALTTLRTAETRSVLIAAFDADRAAARLAEFAPPGAELLSLDAVKLPARLITNPSRYLDAINFATNFVFFRDDDHFGTRLTTINYWSGYGARSVSLFMRLYDAEGLVLAEWTQDLPAKAGAVIIDSGEVRRRLGLRPFTGQLFMHAVGVAGHDNLKYVLDTYSTDGGASLSSTHDANAWPSDRYAGLPAPRPDENVVLWLQNCHAIRIPAGAMALDEMGAEAPVAIQIDIPPFATLAVDVADHLPALHWPSQIELRAGRYTIRPRYEVRQNYRTRIAHMNVERSDLRADPGINTLSAALGRGFILPFPILPRPQYNTAVLPTAMSTGSLANPLRIDIFSDDGAKIAEQYLGALPRKHRMACDLDVALQADQLSRGGHAELVYDFREGGEVDGWLHAVFRYERRDSGHVAESSFGAHIFNTIMTYKQEPQSYRGPPPGLSTRLYLKLGTGGLDSFCVLIYPASAPWHAHSRTMLELYSGSGESIATTSIEIACCGSATIYPSLHFEAVDLRRAGEAGYLLVRDATCRLFGFHGLDDRAGRFSFDHMFGF
jgi:hypothetical protein